MRFRGTRIQQYVQYLSAGQAIIVRSPIIVNDIYQRWQGRAAAVAMAMTFTYHFKRVQRLNIRYAPPF